MNKIIITVTAALLSTSAMANTSTDIAFAGSNPVDLTQEFDVVSPTPTLRSVEAILPALSAVQGAFTLGASSLDIVDCARLNQFVGAHTLETCEAYNNNINTIQSLLSSLDGIALNTSELRGDINESIHVHNDTVVAAAQEAQNAFISDNNEARDLYSAYLNIVHQANARLEILRTGIESDQLQIDQLQPLVDVDNATIEALRTSISSSESMIAAINNNLVLINQRSYFVEGITRIDRAVDRWNDCIDGGRSYDTCNADQDHSGVRSSVRHWFSLAPYGLDEISETSSIPQMREVFESYITTIDGFDASAQHSERDRLVGVIEDANGAISGLISNRDDTQGRIDALESAIARDEDRITQYMIDTEAAWTAYTTHVNSTPHVTSTQPILH